MVFECLLSESLLCTVVAVAAFAIVGRRTVADGAKAHNGQNLYTQDWCQNKNAQTHKTNATEKRFTREMLQTQQRSTRKIYRATMESDRNMLQILKTPKTTVREMLLIRCTKWRHTRLLGGADLFANLYIIIEEGRSCVARNPRHNQMWHKQLHL